MTAFLTGERAFDRVRRGGRLLPPIGGGALPLDAFLGGGELSTHPTYTSVDVPSKELIVIGAGFGASGSAGSFTDSAGTTYATSQGGAGTGGFGYAVRATTLPSGTLLNYSGTYLHTNLVAASFVGFAAVGAYGFANTVWSFSSPSTAVSTTVSVTALDLVVGVWTQATGSTLDRSPAAPSGWIKFGFGTGSNSSTGGYYRQPGTSGTATLDFGTVGAGNTGSTSIIAFKRIGGGGGMLL